MKLLNDASPIRYHWYWGPVANSRLVEQNPRFEYRKFNALRTQKLRKKELCDKTGTTHGALVVLFSALQLLQLPALHWFTVLVVRKFFE